MCTVKSVSSSIEQRLKCAFTCYLYSVHWYCTNDFLHILTSAKTLVPGSSKYLLTEEDVITDEVVARMLMYHPWQHEKHVYLWKGTITIPHDNQ